MLALFSYGCSDLLMNAFVFIIKAIKRTGSGSTGEKARKFILIQIDAALVNVVFFVVIVKYTAFAAASLFLLFHSVFLLYHLFIRRFLPVFLLYTKTDKM